MNDTERLFNLLKQRHAPDYPEQDLRLLALELSALLDEARVDELKRYIFDAQSTSLGNEDLEAKIHKRIAALTQKQEN